MTRECLDCGMAVVDAHICPKCDSNLDAQHDGSVRKVDIAHNRETRAEAMRKLGEEIESARFRPAQFLRLVVGSGLIRDEALAELEYYERRRMIKGYRTEGANRGAILVRLK